MRHIRIKKHIFLFIAIGIVLLQNFTLVEAAEIYHPYPIIFVHGIDPGDWGTFGFTRHRLNDCFYNILAIKPEEKYKYFHKNEEGYFPKCDYSNQNNGDITNIAETTLQQVIKSALSSYPPEVPESERKVIIVAHSMGGLVVRSFLQQFPSYKELGIIDKVIFIGTPHLGSPFASAVWSLKKVYREVLDPMVRDYAEFYSQNVGTRRTFADESSNMSVDGLINDALSSEIQDYRDQLYRDLPLREKRPPDPTSFINLFTPDPDGIALEQLRLAGDVRYCKVFRNAYKNKEQKIIVDLTIDGAKTFLGKANLYLSNPNKYFTILGDYQGGDINIPARWINTLREKYEPDFIYFPTFGGVVQSVSNAIKDGDGVVTTQSQLGIGGPYTTISVYHTEEANQYQTILQAIDDAPVIESVRFIMGPPDGSDYIIVKVKDYLLADIEIAQLTNADLTEFRDPTGKYKPYIKYPNRGFLTERDVTLQLSSDKSQKIHLKPGEFHAKLSKLEAGTIYIKMKNAAGKETSCEVELVEPSVMTNGVRRYVNRGRGNTGPEGCQPQAPAPYFQQFRQDAIDVFFNSEVSYPYPNVYPPSAGDGNQPYYYITSPIGGSAYSDLAASAGGNQPWPYPYYYYSWHIQAESRIAPSLNFKLAVGRAVKSARLIGTFRFENFKQKKLGEEIIEEEKNIDFSVSFLNENDNVAFILDTTSFESGDMFDIEIEPQYLNLNGNNTWTFSDNFLEDNSLTANCFPNYYIEPPLSYVNGPPVPSTHIKYNQQAYINDPLLVITLEEDVQN